MSFEKLTAGSVSFGCGHTYCNSPTCASRLVDICPECRVPVNARVLLFGALPDVDRLLEQEPAVYDVEQVERAAEKNTKPALEVILQSMFRIATLLLEAQAADALAALGVLALGAHSALREARGAHCTARGAGGAGLAARLRGGAGGVGVGARGAGVSGGGESR